MRLTVTGSSRPYSVMRLRSALTVVLFIVIAALLSAAPALAKPKGEVVLVTTSGRHPIGVEWAITEAEHEQGLMFRKEMPANHGMIFVFKKEEPVYFWMHNTPLPLDMIFIARDGTVRRIEKSAVPYSDTVIPSGAAISYVLEVNGGVADRLGLAVGDKVEIPPH